MKFTHFGKSHITLSFCISLPPLTYVKSIRFCTGMISTVDSPSHCYSTCTKCISHHQNEPRRYLRCTSSCWLGLWFWFCYSVLLIVVENLTLLLFTNVYDFLCFRRRPKNSRFTFVKRDGAVQATRTCRTWGRKIHRDPGCGGSKNGEFSRRRCCQTIRTVSV